MPKLKGKTIFIFLLSLIILYVVIYIIPSLTGALTSTEVIKYGEMRIYDDVKCYILRDETVYSASAKGTLKTYVEEGTQVKKGTKILDVTTTGGETKESEYKDITDKLGDTMTIDESGTSKRKGVLSYKIDGYEDYFSPKNIESLKYDKLTELKIEPKSIKRDSTEKGEPVYKISDNAKWYIVCFIDEEDISKYEEGKEVKVALTKGEIKGTIDKIYEEGDKWKVSIITNRYYKGFEDERIVDGSIITTDQAGLIISNGCLTTKDKKVGVYVRTTTGDYVFKPVQVYISDGKQSLVAESFFYNDKGETVNTVNVYDEILKNPKVDSEK